MQETNIYVKAESEVEPFVVLTKGQLDKLKILPWAGMGRDSLSKSGTEYGTRQSLFFS